MTYYGRWTYKYEEAARRGAVGVLIIHRTDLASYGWEVVQNSQAIEKSYLQGDPTPRCVPPHGFSTTSHSSFSPLPAWAISTRRSTRPASAASTPSNSMSPQGPFESRVRHYDSTNVVRPCGRCGRRTATLFSTPLTMIISASIQTRKATTSTTARPTMAPAAAFCWSWHAPSRNRRSAHRTRVLRCCHGRGAGPARLAVSGHASAGSRTRHHPRPELRHAAAHRRSAFGEPRRRRAHRFLAHSSKQWRKTSTCSCCPIPTPGAGHYYRSDHFSLARVGIPAFSIDQGSLFEGHDEAWGHAQFGDFVAHHYHQPSDEYQRDWDFRGNAKMARFGFVLGWLASEQPKSVEWQSGDEFETPRKKSLAH